MPDLHNDRQGLDDMELLLMGSRAEQTPDQNPDECVMGVLEACRGDLNALFIITANFMAQVSARLIAENATLPGAVAGMAAGGLKKFCDMASAKVAWREDGRCAICVENRKRRGAE